MHSIFYFLVVFILSCGCIQANTKSAPSSRYTLTVVYGDNKSEFRISNDSTGASLEYVSSFRGSRKDKISPKNYGFINEKAALTLPFKNNEKDLCSRKYIELKGTINGQAVEKLGCIGSKTKISKKMTELANTLDLQVF
jgi:hypothetical protein